MFMIMLITIKHKNRRIRVSARKAGFIEKITGLIFRTRNTHNLLFNFGRDARPAIHSFFVFFPFLAVWLDKNNEVIDARIVQPFTLSELPKNKRKFRKLLELPLNNSNRKILNFFVGKGKV